MATWKFEIIVFVSVLHFVFYVPNHIVNLPIYYYIITNGNNVILIFSQIQSANNKQTQQ
jgi:hypothetical protein